VTENANYEAKRIAEERLKAERKKEAFTLD
jgi:hypothetical protein